MSAQGHTTSSDVGAAAEATLASAAELGATYRAAQPWPHLVLHDLIPPELTRAAYDEEKTRLETLPRTANRWQAKAETAEGFGPAASAIMRFLDRPEWVRFMETVTGVEPLQADPTHVWAGLHANGPGSFHLVHRDFPKHPENGLWHRANVLVYLNPEWPDAWGGQLELWRPRGRRSERIIAPSGGTVVVFETHAGTLHGLPEPIACPPNEARLSLNGCYYSELPPPGPLLQPLVRRPRRPQDPWRTGIATRREIMFGVYERLPDPVLRLGRAVKRWLGR
jgi:Rps23 Pro-64 3,4-dihydroxylase Tpa1-like proline 4-hydroxylase